MGNCGLGGHSQFKHVVKLVHSNGLVEEFHRLVKAGEIMVDYPHHFICHVDSLSQLMMASSNGVLASLSEDDDLETGQIYFLLPKHVLDSHLTEADIAAFISKASIARKTSYRDSRLAPLPLPPKPSLYNRYNADDDDDGAYVKRPMSSEFVQRVLAEARSELQRREAADPFLSKQLGSNPELQSAFTNHIVAKSCARLWRPPLDTIYEDTSIPTS